MKLFGHKPRSKGDRGWLERFVKERAGEMALVSDRVRHEEFLRFCIEAAPVPTGSRDTRRQAFVRTMRRMAEKGELPFRVDGELFVFD